MPGWLSGTDSSVPAGDCWTFSDSDHWPPMWSGLMCIFSLLPFTPVHYATDGKTGRGWKDAVEIKWLKQCRSKYSPKLFASGSRMNVLWGAGVQLCSWRTQLLQSWPVHSFSHDVLVFTRERRGFLPLYRHKVSHFFIAKRNEHRGVVARFTATITKTWPLIQTN